ncbi:MAG: sensor histidine kinase [Epsilonproteobacteria bacterium]|nr:MAG: sensor histidine kinase [Campylobacterota bacterium]
MLNRPHFKEYMMARLVTIAVFIFLFFSVIFFLFIPKDSVLFMAMALLALGFSIFIFVIYHMANHMQKELNTINVYLANLDKVDSIEYKARFFTQEFEEINQNLIRALKKAQKREDIKQRYNAKLKLKNRQRADMISAIAHEFRNPIASIMGYAQTLKEDKEISLELQEKFLAKIYNNGVKIEALLARLVLWNKFENKEAILALSHFDFYDLLQEVKATLEEKYPHRNIHIGKTQLEIKADRTLLEIVLNNLIENALKYSKEEIFIEVDEGYVLIHDKGIGISASEVSKITKKFYRSDTQSWDNSMGLGLSIVKSILALHGKKLEIKSEENFGSTFSFQL